MQDPADEIHADFEGQQPYCPFCSIAAERLQEQNHDAVALLDAYPISPGHTLVVPRRHAASLFDLTASETSQVWELVAAVRKSLMGRHRPDGFNIGLNDGIAAGQTVMHAHVHVVPRYKGDVADPRGGIRWILPSKARYW